MCFNGCFADSEKQLLVLKRRAKKQKKAYIYAYKALLKNSKTLISPFKFSEYKPGFKESGRISNEIKQNEINNFIFSFQSELKIKHGIHVFLTKKRLIAEVDRGYNRVGVKVRCYLKDYVAGGNGQAVFTRVYLTKTEFKRGLKGQKWPVK